MSEKIRVLLSEEEVDTKIREIAAQISREYSLPVSWPRESRCR